MAAGREEEDTTKVVSEEARSLGVLHMLVVHDIAAVGLPRQRLQALQKQVGVSRQVVVIVSLRHMGDRRHASRLVLGFQMRRANGGGAR